MQFDKRKTKIVKAAFNPKNKNILRPDKIIPWKISLIHSSTPTIFRF